MGTFQGPYHDRVRYKLQHKLYGNIKVKSADVIGWDDDDKEQHRNDDYSGVFPKWSNSLKFTGEAKNYINAIRRIYGRNEEIRIIKDEKDQLDIWQRVYSGYLTVKTWEEDDGIVGLKFDSGGLEKILKARKKVKTEIERTIDLKGNTIPSMPLKKLHLPGRRIFLITKFKNASVDNELKLSVETNAGKTRRQAGGIPIIIESQSHDLANSVQFQSLGSSSRGTTGMMFYAVNDRTRILNIDISFSLDAFFRQYENVQWCRYQVCFSIYNNGSNYDLKERKVLYEIRSDSRSPTTNLIKGGVSVGNLPSDFPFPFPKFTKKIEGSFNLNIELLEGESMALECLLASDMSRDIHARVRCYAQNIEANLQINEDSNFPSTITNGVLAYELLERYVEIMTGSKNNFKSNYFGRKELGYDEDGPGAYIFFSHGHWIRLFEKGDDLYKPFTSSFQDILQTLKVLKHVNLGIENRGFQEIIVIEEESHFYNNNNNNTTVRLGEFSGDKFVYNQVKKVKRKSIEDLYFGEIEIGSDIAGEYEEVFGLEETNTKANFSTPIENDNVYSKISKHRWDTYGPEIIRRRNKEIKPTDDHSFDSHIFLFDVKKGLNDIYELKKWEDVLETKPLNMFDPDSSYNFLWSLVQLVLTHGWYLNGGLQEFPMDFIRFGSSVGKSSVVIHPKGKKSYAENGNIAISDLDRARFTPEEVSLEYEVSLYLNSLIEGQQTIRGSNIENIYGLFEYKNEVGKLEKARIISIKPNNKGEFKLLKRIR